MKYLFAALFVVVVLVGCTQKNDVVSDTAKSSDDTGNFIEVPTTKPEKESQNTALYDEDSVTTYNIPELGISFNLEKKFVNDLVHTANNDAVSFNSKSLNRLYDCPNGQSGVLSKVPIKDQCISSESVYTSEDYRYCFGGPQALCAPTADEEFANDISSARIVSEAVKNIKNL